MSKIFNVQDRQEVFDYILSITKENSKIVALVQVGSGSYGYHDEKSDLDFVIALDSDSSMTEMMDYVNEKMSDGTLREAITAHRFRRFRSLRLCGVA